MRASTVLCLVVMSGCAASMERFRAGSSLSGFPLDHLERPFADFHEEQNRAGNAVTRAPYSELGGWVAVLVPTRDSRSPGVPERGLRAWNQFLTPTQLRAKAVEQVKKEALKASLPLLRVEVSGRVAQLLKDAELRGSSSTAELAMLTELFRMVP